MTPGQGEPLALIDNRQPWRPEPMMMHSETRAELQAAIAESGDHSTVMIGYGHRAGAGYVIELDHRGAIIQEATRAMPLEEFTQRRAYFEQLAREAIQGRDPGAPPLQ